jgi:hypothetical protein
VAATYGRGLALLNKAVSVMVEGRDPASAVAVNVVDQCANADCGGCCAKNTGNGRYPLIDLEKWPASKLLGFNPSAPGFDVNDLDLPPNSKGQRPGAPQSVMPLCYKIVGKVAGIP